MSITIALPIVERIAAELVERLSLLTAGYSENTRVSEVIRLPRGLNSYSPKDRQLVVFQDEATPIPELSRPGNPPAVAILQPFVVVAVVLPSERDPTPIDRIVNVTMADVRKVITRTTNWHTFGGLAIQSTIEGPDPINDDGQVSGASLTVNVTYRVSENDPYTKR